MLGLSCLSLKFYTVIPQSDSNPTFTPSGDARLETDPKSLLDRLGPIGWRASLFQQLPDLTDKARVVRVTEVHRETLKLHDGASELGARALPRLLRGHEAFSRSIAVGDWAVAEPDDHGDWWLVKVLPPSTEIRRLDGDGVGHTVVSNVDTLFVVMGLDSDFNLRRAERYWVIARASGVVPVLVLTKMDLCRDVDARLDAARARLGAQIDAIAVNGCDAESCLGLSPYLTQGQTVALMGSSGAGKSTLTNALLGREAQDTGAVREGALQRSMHGKHTTTTRSLHTLAGGACLIDTPGLRTMRVDGGEDAVAMGFEDITALAKLCRFADCSHANEPGCAVRHSIDAARLHNYNKLLRDAKRDTLNALERKAQMNKWRRLGRESNVNMEIRGKK